MQVMLATYLATYTSELKKTKAQFRPSASTFKKHFVCSFVPLVPCYPVTLFPCSLVPLFPCCLVILFSCSLFLYFLSLFPCFPVPLFSCSFVPSPPVFLFPVPLFPYLVSRLSCSPVLFLLFPSLRADADWKFKRYISDISQNEELFRTENLFK